MKMNPRLCGQIVLSLLIVVIFISGCGKKGFPRNETSGTVTFKGKTVPNAMVSFVPVPGSTYGQYGLAKTDANGVYNMRISSGDGIPEGSYTVSIAPEGWGGAMPIKCEWSEKFCKTETSELTAEVVKGKNVLDFSLDK